MIILTQFDSRDGTFSGNRNCVTRQIRSIRTQAKSTASMSYAAKQTYQTETQKKKTGTAWESSGQQQPECFEIASPTSGRNSPEKREIDKLAGQLPTWKSSLLLTPAGRTQVGDTLAFDICKFTTKFVEDLFGIGVDAVLFLGTNLCSALRLIRKMLTC
jgi:hypothetical protein